MGVLIVDRLRFAVTLLKDYKDHYYFLKYLCYMCLLE